jgi:hypothetical protein
MKRISILALAVVAVGALTSCGGQSSGEDAAHLISLLPEEATGAHVF